MRAAIVAVLAISPAAADAKEPERNLELADELRKNEDLVKRFGTVGYPLADELKPDRTCNGAALELGFSDVQDFLGTPPYAVGLGATLTPVSDANRLGVELVAAPTVEMLGEPVAAPVATTVRAHANADGTSSVDIDIFALGFVLTHHDATQAAALSFERWFGYHIPTVIPLEPDDLGWFVNPPLTWAATADVHTYVGGFVSAEAAATGMQTRALLAASSYAELDIEIRDRDKVVTASERLDVIDFQFGGRAQVLPRSGGTWIADTAATTTVRDAMGLDLTVSISEPPGSATLELVPFSFTKEVEMACELESKISPKR